MQSRCKNTKELTTISIIITWTPNFGRDVEMEVECRTSWSEMSRLIQSTENITVKYNDRLINWENILAYKLWKDFERLSHEEDKSLR
jgi:hypothetical protein